MRIYTRREAAELLRISPRSLGDRGWRRKVGLQGSKIGARLVFSEDSLMRFLARNREVVPTRVSGCHGTRRTP